MKLSDKTSGSQLPKEANTALKVLLKHRDEDRKELEKRFLSNVQQLVMPYVEKLKKSTLDPVQRMSLGFIESNLNELTSPFLKSVQSFNFTPRQLEVATLIREGKTTKDIAHLEHEPTGSRNTEILDTKEARFQQREDQSPGLPQISVIVSIKS